MYRLNAKLIYLGIVLMVLTFALSVDAQDKVSKTLDENFIWNVQDTSTKGDLHVVFRKTFTVTDINTSASLNLFAYNRFAVFINGKYVT